MEEALRALLVGDTALAAIVGTRIFWDTIPQATPGTSVVLYLISGVPDYHMLGPSGLVDSRVQIDCRSTSWDGARDASRAVEAVLSGHSGTVGAVRFGVIARLSARSDYDTTGAEAFFRASADYRIWSGPAA